ncbi:MAG: hypothetical protein QM731_06885 [Chitinophagaceae bacterium]
MPIFILLFVVLLSALGANAQTPDGHAKNARHSVTGTTISHKTPDSATAKSSLQELL